MIQEYVICFLQENGSYLAVSLLMVVVAYVFIFSKNICSKCGHNEVSHSHTEIIGSVEMEVYKCANCGNKYL